MRFVSAVCVLIVSILYAHAAHAQTGLRPDVRDTDAVRHMVEVLPAFDNGHAGWNRFLENNMDVRVINRVVRRDRALRKNGLKEKVIAQFIVCEDGGICNISIVNKDLVHPEFAAEVVRVMRLSPPWKPGMQDGKAVKVYFTQPIIFSID